ncbi:MAG: efflux RND transporter periplasmic adaptor subunit [Desulfomonile tiedjei]|uniref:Efflux RND transporter periplasmic adaptor subunit n=1 Tax=Desulfomonile tiedjei TaxID=2358 RepID=A0A9D6V0K5_9BACT|nr:efflux RND transporter periplasmic adaptor subunit [Desulfomonile tiedjei]
MRGRPRHLIVTSALLVLCFLSACSQKPAKKALPPPDVTAVQPQQKEVTKYLEYTGNTTPVATVDIRARVPGFLEKMYFEPRAKVKAGDLLFLIDPRQYQANVKEAKGRLEAQKASSKLAQTEVQISQQLESKEAISALRLEKKVAERDVAAADVDLADATLDKAKLDLEWTRVTSPIDGRVSRNKVDVGNLVGANEKTLLTTVVSDDPIYAYFGVSELDLLPALRRMTNPKADSSTKPSSKLPVYLGLADETGYPHEGHFDFAETTVDSSTGTIQVRGIFPNPDGLLMGGMFVRIRVPSEKRTVLLIPDISVQFDQGGRYVLVVDDANMVHQKRIKMGEQVEDMRVIEEGLNPTDRVIATGVQRARAGSKVNIIAAPAGAPKSDSAAQGKTKEK